MGPLRGSGQGPACPGPGHSWCHWACPQHHRICNPNPACLKPGVSLVPHPRPVHSTTVRHSSPHFTWSHLLKCQPTSLVTHLAGAQPFPCSIRLPQPSSWLPQSPFGSFQPIPGLIALPSCFSPSMAADCRAFQASCWPDQRCRPPRQCLSRIWQASLCSIPSPANQRSCHSAITFVLPTLNICLSNINYLVDCKETTLLIPLPNFSEICDSLPCENIEVECSI